MTVPSVIVCAPHVLRPQGPGQGSWCFPRSRVRGVSRRVSRTAMATVSAEAKPSVLIVDDDVVLCEMLSEHLKSEYRVQCAHTCGEALTRMNAQQADVVILDYARPDGPGLSVVHQLRSCNPRLRTTTLFPYFPTLSFLALSA